MQYTYEQCKIIMSALKEKREKRKREGYVYI